MVKFVSKIVLSNVTNDKEYRDNVKDVFPLLNIVHLIKLIHIITSCVIQI